MSPFYRHLLTHNGCENGASPILYNYCTNTYKLNEQCLKNCSKEEMMEPELFENKDQFHEEAKHLFHGDLYVIGRLWINAMKSALLGTSLLPSVKAAAPDKDQPVEKPNRVRPSELPMYGNRYGPYKCDQVKYCKEVNDKMLHTFMLPYLKEAKTKATEVMKEVKEKYDKTKKDIKDTIKDTKKVILNVFRDENQLYLRVGTVALGGTVGLLAAQNKSCVKKLFYTGAGCLAGGALTFPDEADMAFKNMCYYSAKGLIAIYNLHCNKDFMMREKLPCKFDERSNRDGYKPNVCSSK